MLDTIYSILNTLSDHTSPYLPQISLAIIATLLVIFGQRINRAVKALVRGNHFIIRTLTFILLSTVGYGLLTVNLSDWLVFAFKQLPYVWIGISVIVSFIALGVLAERQSK
jgi:hypothetical protein